MLLCSVVLLWVVLGNLEHAIVLFPVSLEVSILNNNKINNVEGAENAA